MKKTTRGPKPARTTMRPLAIPRWRKLPNGVWKTDLGAGLPEIVILTMSNEEFEKFRASSETAKKTNFDKRRILKQKLIKVVFVPPRACKEKTVRGWIVIGGHTLDSVMALVNYPICE